MFNCLPTTKPDKKDIKNWHTFFENQFTILVRSVTAKVLLDVSVLMVVNSNAVVARSFGEPLNQAGFTHWRLALNQHWQFSEDEVETEYYIYKWLLVK